MVTLTCVFIVAYAFITPTWMALGYHRWNPRGICAFFTLCPLWSTTLMSCHTYALIAAVGIVYQRILREALRIKRQINVTVPASSDDPDATRLQENLHVIKNFAIIVGTSFMVWLPHAMVSNFLSYQPHQYLRQPRVVSGIIVMAVSAMLILVINPIIYATRLKWFKVLLLYIKRSISYRECEQSMSDIWFITTDARSSPGPDLHAASACIYTAITVEVWELINDFITKTLMI